MRLGAGLRKAGAVKDLASIAAKRASSSVVIRIEVTPQVHAALEALRATGFFGNGQDVESVADELLRWALRQHEDFAR